MVVLISFSFHFQSMSANLEILKQLVEKVGIRFLTQLARVRISTFFSNVFVEVFKNLYTPVGSRTGL